MIMEQSREDMRKMTLCLLARTVCQVVRSSRCILDEDDVYMLCDICADICDEYCKQASKSCSKALEYLEKGNENEYLKYCERARKECNESENTNMIPMQCNHDTKDKAFDDKVM